MRIGRLIDPGDILFGDTSQPSAVSAGGVVLSRTATDDYVRFRVPDTSCPPLPEPSSPLDSGVADEAEPNRWLYGGQYVSGTGWRFGATSGQALDWIRPSYTCYDGDFVVDVSLTWDDSGLPRGHSARASDFDLFVVGITSPNIGICIGAFGSESANQPWVLDVRVYNNGNVGAVLGYIIAGQTKTLRLGRTGGSIWVAYESNSQQVASGVSGQVQLKLWRDFNTEGVHIPGVTVTGITTQSGAPSSVTVTSPVVDMGGPVEVNLSRVPNTGTLEWRASNTPFNSEDPSPAWSSPAGSYRYWQVRLVWTDPSILLERLEWSVSSGGGGGGGGPVEIYRGPGIYWGVGSVADIWHGVHVRIPVGLVRAAGLARGGSYFLKDPNSQVERTDGLALDRVRRYWLFGLTSSVDGVTVGFSGHEDSIGSRSFDLSIRIRALLESYLSGWLGYRREQVEAQSTEILNGALLLCASVRGVTPVSAQLDIREDTLVLMITVRLAGVLEDIQVVIGGRYAG